MENIAAFKEVAPYLTNPLVLVGFALLLFFGLRRALLKAEISLPPPPHTGSKVVQSFLRYGFIMALVVIFLGFLLSFYQARLQHDTVVQTAPQIPKSAAKTSPRDGEPTYPTRKIEQNTGGGPAVANTGGDVRINMQTPTSKANDKRQ